jgi:membrane protein
MTSSADYAVQFWRFARLLGRRYSDDRLNRVAQALSYTTVLAVVPFTTVAFAILSVFPVFEEWMATIQTFIYKHFVAASGDTVQYYLQQFSQKSAQLTAIGLLFLIVTALMLMETIEYTFNEIWRVQQKRKALYRFLTYWAILTLGPILLVVSLSLTSYVVSLPLFEKTIGGGVRAFFLNSLPFLFETLAFALLYMVVPNTHVRWRHALAGCVLTAILFEVAKWGFAYFVVNFSAYQLIYGAIATLPVFLIWIYLSWMIILLGAEFVAIAPFWGKLDSQLGVQQETK